MGLFFSRNPSFWLDEQKTTEELLRNLIGKLIIHNMVGIFFNRKKLRAHPLLLLDLGVFTLATLLCPPPLPGAPAPTSLAPPAPHAHPTIGIPGRHPFKMERRRTRTAEPDPLSPVALWADE